MSSNDLGHGHFHSGSSINICHDVLQDYGIDDPECFILQNGTKANPFVTFVDSTYPERNGEMCGCDITLVHCIEYNNYLRAAYKIFLEMLPHDFQEFKMFIPLYHYAGTNNIDDVTKKAIKHDAIGINESKEGNWSYHLFKWPVGTCLDNNIFSANSDVVKSEVHPLKLSADHKHNPFGKDMNACAIIWTISINGRDCFQDDQDHSTTDLSLMF
eukprot:2145728-Ditylum_brightwellii.AAC.1